MSKFKNISNAILAALLCFSMNAFSVSDSDSLSLVSLYNSTNGESWVKSDNWLTGSIDTWYGIVTENEKVVAINLSGNNLEGMLPLDLYNLKDLEYIYVSFNQLTGPLLDDVHKLKNLQVLWISNNQIGGTLPLGLGGVDSLRTLYLNGNNFEGVFPDTIANLSKLESINISDNNFSGTLSSRLGELENLTYFMINNNAFTGAIPATFANLSLLRCFNISYNQFSEMANLMACESLNNNLPESDFIIHHNLFDFSDLLLNKEKLGVSENYYPQKTFTLSSLIDIHPGDKLSLDMPGASLIDTSDAHNSYRYLVDNKECKSWGSDSKFTIAGATYVNSGTYKCEVMHDSFPDLKLLISSVRLLPPSGYSWISLATKVNGAIVDTLDYKVVAMKKSGSGYVPMDIADTVLNKRKEMLLPNGTYLLSLVPKGEDSVYFTKYHKNEVRWLNSQVSVFGNRKDYAYNVTVLEKVYLSGNGQLSGTVFESYSASGDMAEPVVDPVGKDNVRVLLYSLSLNKWINETYSDTEGRYAFDELEDGEYKVYIDYPGYSQGQVGTVVLNEASMMQADINFTMYNSDNIVLNIENKTAPKDISNIFTVSVSGNKELQVRLNEKIVSNGSLGIFDLGGKLVYQTTIRSSEGLRILPAFGTGIYIVQCRCDGKSFSQKVVLR